jgi:hypothetical protein
MMVKAEGDKLVKPNTSMPPFPNTVVLVGQLHGDLDLITLGNKLAPVVAAVFLVPAQVSRPKAWFQEPEMDRCDVCNQPCSRLRGLAAGHRTTTASLLTASFIDQG